MSASSSQLPTPNPISSRIIMDVSRLPVTDDELREIHSILSRAEAVLREQASLPDPSAELVNTVALLESELDARQLQPLNKHE